MPLWARLREPERYPVAPDADVDVEALLARWIETSANGRREAFDRRLLWSGWTIEAARVALSGPVALTEQTAPSWVHTLAGIVARTAADGYARSPDGLTSQFEDTPLPFEQVWLPAVGWARDELFARMGAAPLARDSVIAGCVSAAGYIALENMLLRQLIELGAKVLLARFDKTRPFGLAAMKAMMPVGTPGAGTDRFDTFCTDLMQDGLLALFEEYAVLGRMVAVTAERWLFIAEELLHRLEADHVQIAQTFGDGELGCLNGMSDPLSDPHAGGRVVLALGFETGVRLLYKPKDLTMDRAFDGFVSALAQHGAPASALTPKVLHRGDYGWVEMVQHRACEDADEVRNFFVSSGALLCAVHMLRGTDCHAENIIAVGDAPILIDTETLLHMSAVDDRDKPQAADERFWRSVLRTGMLPRWEFSVDRSVAYDMSALGRRREQRAPVRQQRWGAMNHDDMFVAYREVELGEPDNLPVFDGVQGSASEHVQDILQGFEQTHAAVRGNASEIRDVLKAQFAGAPVRYIFRATNVYTSIMRHSLEPDCLKSGVARSIQVDVLARPFLLNDERPDGLPILDFEIDSIESLDVPRFDGRTDATELTFGDSSVERFFYAPSLTGALADLTDLDDADFEIQRRVIVGSLSARSMAPTATEVYSERPVVEVAELDRSALLAEAEIIAEKIVEEAIVSRGRANWISMRFVSRAERFQLEPLKDDLYSGRVGVAVFLAALDSIGGDQRHAELIDAALGSLAEAVHQSPRAYADMVARYEGLGAGSGLGAIIYSLCVLSSLTGRADLLEWALALAHGLTRRYVQEDLRIDALSGTAGLALGLLPLIEATDDSEARDLLRACTQRLIDVRVETPGTAHRAWPTFGTRPLNGMSHGAAGVALALARAGRLLGDASLTDAANEGVAYEGDSFDADVGNWPDFRQDVPSFMSTWCHGAPGIGLARAAMLDVLQGDARNEVRADLQRALQSCDGAGLLHLDHCCCGNAGWTELYLEAARVLERPELLARAYGRLTAMLDRRREKGAYVLFTSVSEDMYSPTFFQGTAGIGYELLRTIDRNLPCVLTWASPARGA